MRSFRYQLVLQGIAVGALASLVSVLYRIVIEEAGIFMNWMLSLGRQSLGWAAFWFLLLAAAAFAVAKLVEYEPMISGSGIPQVEGELHGLFNPRWLRVIAAKFIGGAIAIGAGLSLGREGPSIQLGAMAGKGFSKKMGRGRTEEKMLITCGAGAGLAAAFNAPFAGVLFTLEEMHKNFSVDVMLSTMTACVTSDFISRNVFGLDPVFTFHNVQKLPLYHYWMILLLGVILGAAGAFYNFCIAKSQQFYGKVKWKNTFVKMLLPFFAAGVLGFTLPQVLGGGHQLVGAISGYQFGLGMLAVILAVKFLFSMLSFGSGAPGGIFLPLLVIGALIGGCFGMVVLPLAGMDAGYLQNFVMLAMAGYFSAIVRAPITGIILINEMTGSFTELLSISVVSLTAYIVADLLKSVPVYDQLLARLIKQNGGAASGDVSDTAKLLFELPVYRGAAAEGAKIKDIPWPKDCLIVSIRRQEKEIIPNGSAQLMGGDMLTVLCSEQSAYFIREEIIQTCQQYGGNPHA